METRTQPRERMSVDSVFEICRERGVTILLDGENVKLEGPEEWITESLVDSVRRRKPEIIAKLQAETMRLGFSPEHQAAMKWFCSVFDQLVGIYADRWKDLSEDERKIKGHPGNLAWHDDIVEFKRLIEAL